MADRVFRIAQSAYDPPPDACNYVVNPSQAIVSFENVAARLNVAAASNCSWTAASESNFIHVVSGGTGSGSGSVSYTVDNNTAGESRTGSLLVAGRVIYITQRAVGDARGRM